MTMSKFVLVLGTLLAACSGGAVPSAVAPASKVTACEGGSVKGDAELASYAHCVSIAGDLDVSHVTSLEPLERLRSVQGALVVRDTERLYSFVGLESLRRVQTLHIERNRGLISIGSLDSLTYAKKVTIARNPRLTSTHGFMKNLAREGGELSIVGNVGLRAEGVASEERVSLF